MRRHTGKRDSGTFKVMDGKIMKKRIKILIDALMTVLLLFLMARQLIGDTAHEWIGAIMFLLWIVHHILNRNWYGHLFRGRYTPFRIFQTVINSALFLTMAGQMVSGIVISREIFAALPISRGIALGRPLHVFCGYWCFVLMALHLGVHWNMVLGKIAGGAVSGKRLAALRLIAAAIAGYGLYAFIKNGFYLYMFLVSSFVFFDFERPTVLYFTEYLAVMGLFVYLAHYGGKKIRRLSGKNRRT